MKAYSQDLRERIVTAIEKGKSCSEVACLFDVSLSTVKRYVRQWKEQGHLRPRMITRRPSKKLALLQARLQAQLEAAPDATLQERCRQWEAQEGVKVSIATMSRAIHLLRKRQSQENSSVIRSRSTFVPDNNVITSDLWDSDLLRAERKRRGWSQEKVAQALGVDVTTVYRWERGKSMPYLCHRQRLAALFGMMAQQADSLLNANA
jgi:transposase